jgi:hypothetical protein
MDAAGLENRVRSWRHSALSASVGGCAVQVRAFVHSRFAANGSLRAEIFFWVPAMADLPPDSRAAVSPKKASSPI